MKKLIPLLTTLALLGCGIPYSDGDRVGSVFKFSHKGLLCKTWEGQLATKGFAKASSDSDGNSTDGGNIFEFTVSDETIIPTIQAALLSGRQVKLTYHQVLLPVWCSSDTGYFITKVETL